MGVKREAPLSTLRIGAKLRHARLLLGLSLTQLGAKIGVTEGYLSYNLVRLPKLIGPTGEVCLEGGKSQL